MENLRATGPTPYPEPLRHAQTRQMMNHVGTEFHTTMVAVASNTGTIIQTKNDISLLTGAGTRG